MKENYKGLQRVSQPSPALSPEALAQIANAQDRAHALGVSMEMHARVVGKSAVVDGRVGNEFIPETRHRVIPPNQLGQ